MRPSAPLPFVAVWLAGCTDAAPPERSPAPAERALGYGAPMVFLGSATGPVVAQDLGDDGVHGFPAGDVDGDGFEDLVSVRLNQRFVGYPLGELYRGSATGLASAGPVDLPQVLTTTGTADIRSVTRVNLDGDGYDDLVLGLADPGFGSSRLTLLRGGPGGPQLDAPQFLADSPLFAQGTTADAGDVDGDGFHDLLLASASGGTHLLPGGPDGPDLLARREVWPGDAWSCAGAGDLNADGFDDLFVTSGGELRMYAGGPAGIDPGDYTLLGAPGGMHVGAVGDVDADGHADLVFGDPAVNPYNPANAWWAPGCDGDEEVCDGVDNDCDGVIDESCGEDTAVIDDTGDGGVEPPDGRGGGDRRGCGCGTGSGGSSGLVWLAGLVSLRRRASGGTRTPPASTMTCPILVHGATAAMRSLPVLVISVLRTLGSACRTEPGIPWTWNGGGDLSIGISGAGADASWVIEGLSEARLADLAAQPPGNAEPQGQPTTPALEQWMDEHEVNGFFSTHGCDSTTMGRDQILVARTVSDIPSWVTCAPGPFTLSFSFSPDNPFGDQMLMVSLELRGSDEVTAYETLTYASREETWWLDGAFESAAPWTIENCQQTSEYDDDLVLAVEWHLDPTIETVSYALNQSDRDPDICPGS